MPANPQKDTIYIDIDDDITGVIEKVRSSKEKIVALVLPKRAPVLQSIVNMKLLKRTAAEAKKSIVLITSDPNVLPLAGAVGVHVAKTLQSKPTIPPAPEVASVPKTVTESVEVSDADDAVIDKTKPIGELAGIDAAEETIEIDDTDAEAEAAVESKETSNKKKKSFKIPNFNSFRTRLFLGIAAVLLLVGGWIMAFIVLPKATVVVRTDTNTLDADLTFTASIDAEELNQEEQIVPALRQELRKTDNERAPATGEENKGKKATGEVTLSLTNCSANRVTIPAGTGVSTNNLTFITQDDVTLRSVQIGGECSNDQFTNLSTDTVEVVAQNAGEQYNIGADSEFIVAGYSSVSGNNDDPITGGTDDIVKIVKQEDIDAATQAVIDRNSEEARKELSAQLEEEGYIALEDTFVAGEPVVTNTPNVGDEASDVTVSASTTFTMLGVLEEDLKTIVESSVSEQIDTTKQVILDNGLDQARFTIDEILANGARVTVASKVTAGPELNEETIKNEVIGKKKGEAIEQLESRPGIEEVEITYSPFWVYSTPGSSKKITVTFEQANSN